MDYAKRRYSDFDLDFHKIAGEYLVKARSFAGEAKHPFSLPFTEEAARDFILRVESSISKEPQKSDFIKNFGSALFEAVFQKDVRALYKSTADLIEAKEEEGLRVRLHLQDVPELAHLPWEYLYQASTNQFLCLNRRTPLVRYLDLPKVIPPLQIKPPLQILVLISSPSDLAYLDVNNERQKIKTALADLEKRGLVKIDFVDKATVTELQRLLWHPKYHVFHFVGHGDFDENNHQGLLAFENEDESVNYISAEQLSVILNNHRSFRLVVLNSCEGARTSLINPFAGTATTLMQQGIPAVVAMQFEISDLAAIKFASVFYASIAEALPIDMAVTEARVSIFSSGNHIEWGTPVLFMRSSDGSLFDLKTKTLEEKFIAEKRIEPPTISETAPSKPQKEKQQKKRHKYLIAALYAFATLFFGVLTFLILSVLPKSMVIEIEVFAKRVSFALSPEIPHGEEVSLLHSGIWSKAVRVENFLPFTLTFDSLLAPVENRPLQNSLTFTPNSLNCSVSFISHSPDISLQDVICDSASKISIEQNEEILSLEVHESSTAPYQQLSFGEYITIAVQECTVTDSANIDFTAFFTDSATLRLDDFARSFNLFGEEGKLYMTLDMSESENEEPTQFVLQEPVQNLEFDKTIDLVRDIRQSTIDSIFIKRNFQFDDITRRSERPGDLEIKAEPNRFLVLDLVQDKNSLVVTAQGRPKSLKIGRGELMEEMVPSYLIYLSRITENRLLSIFITGMGWLLTILVPLIFKHSKKNRRRVNGLQGRF